MDKGVIGLKRRGPNTPGLPVFGPCLSAWKNPKGTLLVKDLGPNEFPKENRRLPTEGKTKVHWAMASI